MNSEKVKEIKELLRCMNGEKACTNCYINEIAEEQETFCINVVANMTLDLINELESENERLKSEKQKVLEYMKTDNYSKLKKEDMYWGYQMGIGMLEHEIDRQKDRIAELEKENEILEGTKGRITFADRINLVHNAIEIKLKQFAERLKEYIEHHHGNYGDLSDSECNDIIDETLKEFINKGE